jgi:hypothetical protein
MTNDYFNKLVEILLQSEEKVSVSLCGVNWHTWDHTDDFAMAYGLQLPRTPGANLPASYFS